mmetsp:Transcript_72612/g.119597  ORF Transcript_72612/g.119597 Transcript_72612/m.119597 type:complete len:291 (+) Transcript_72612:305-1177(+)
MGIDVGIWILHLALLQEHWRNGLIACVDQLEEGILRAVLQGKFTFQHVSWIRVSQHGVAKAWNDLTFLQGLVGKVRQELLGGFLPMQLLLDIQEPRQALLVGQAMQGSRQAAEPGRPGVVRIAQRRAYEVRGVRRDVATFMIRMKHQVPTHRLLETFTLIDPQHLGKVGGPVQLAVVGRHFAIMESPTIDRGRDDGDFGNNVQTIFQGIRPIVILLHAALIFLEELGVLLQRQHRHGELRHGMRLNRQRFDGGQHVRRDRGALVELLREALDLLVSWHLSSDQQPEGTLR